MTSRQFPYFAIPPKVYKKSETIVRLDRERDKEATGKSIDTNRRRTTSRFDKS